MSGYSGTHQKKGVSLVRLCYAPSHRIQTMAAFVSNTKMALLLNGLLFPQHEQDVPKVITQICSQFYYPCIVWPVPVNEITTKLNTFPTSFECPKQFTVNGYNFTLKLARYNIGGDNIYLSVCLQDDATLMLQQQVHEKFKTLYDKVNEKLASKISQ